MPRCSTVQRDAFTPGPTCTDHFHPGSYVARPSVWPLMCTISSRPFGKRRTSSGDSNRLRIVSRLDGIELVPVVQQSFEVGDDLRVRTSRWQFGDADLRSVHVRIVRL